MWYSAIVTCVSLFYLLSIGENGTAIRSPHIEQKGNPANFMSAGLVRVLFGCRVNARGTQLAEGNIKSVSKFFRG